MATLAPSQATASPERDSTSTSEGHPSKGNVDTSTTTTRSLLGRTKKQEQTTDGDASAGIAVLTKPAGRPQNSTAAAPGRFKTFIKAAYKLYSLSDAEVAAFLDSYVIYSLDWKDEAAMRAALGDNFQQRVGDCLRVYYAMLNNLCALGDVEKMYVPPLMDLKLSVRQNQLRYEETIVEDLGLKAGDRVLDLGCGRGRVAAHIATVVPGVRITGLNIDIDQLSQARSFTDKLGLPNDFVEQDFNEMPLPFEDASFDAFYEIQALSLCRDLRALFTEVYRVLKPGARFSYLDWVSLPKYDPTNPEHADLMRRTKPLIGAVGTPTPASLEADLVAAGFEVTKSDIPSLDGLQAPLIDTVDTYFRTLRQLILGLVKVRLLPKHLKTLINRFCLEGEAFTTMDRMRLVTTTYRIIAVKPLNAAGQAEAPAVAEGDKGANAESQAAPR